MGMRTPSGQEDGQVIVQLLTNTDALLSISFL